MQPLIIIKDKDIYPNEIVKEDAVYKTRIAVKAVVIDSDGKVALVGKTNMLLPGGGVEEGETITEAVKRECIEEMGCGIEIKKEIGFTEDYRIRIERRQQTHFFLAHVVGEKGDPQTTQDDEQGIMVDWHTLDETIVFLEKQLVEMSLQSYNACFNVRTHLAALKELKKIGI